MIEICRSNTNFFLELATGKFLLRFNSGLEHQDYNLIFGYLFLATSLGA